MSDNIEKNNIPEDFSTDFDLEKYAKLNLGNKNKPHNFSDKYLSTGKYKSSGIEYQDKYLSEFPDEIATKNSERDFNSEHLPKFGEEKKENLDITDQIEESDNTAEDEVIEENAENQPDTTEDIVENIEDANEANDVNEDIESSVEQANEQNEEINEQNETPAEQNETDTETPEPTEFDQVRQQWEERLARQNAPQNILTRGWNWMKRNHIHKIGLGFGAAGLAFFAPVAGTVGLIAVPVAYGLGLKSGIDGVVGLIQRHFLGGRKLDENLKTIENNIEQKIRLHRAYENSDIEHRQQVMNRLADEINSLNQQYLSTQTTKNNWERRHAFYRSAISTGLSIGIGVGFGVPLGYQNFDGDAISHTVRWSWDGFRYIYENGGLSQALQYATNTGYQLTVTQSYGQAAHLVNAASKFGVPLSGMISMIGTGTIMLGETIYRAIRWPKVSQTPQPTAYEMQQQFADATAENNPNSADPENESNNDVENNNYSTPPPADLTPSTNPIIPPPANPIAIRSIVGDPSLSGENTAADVDNNIADTPPQQPAPEITQENERSEIVSDQAFDSGYDEIDNFVQNISNLRNPAVDRKELVTECYVGNEGGILDSIKNRITKELEKKLSDNSTFDFADYQNKWKNAFTHLKRDDLWQETIKQASESDSPLLKIFAKPEMLSLTPTQFLEIDNLRHKINILKHLGRTSEIETLISSDNDLSNEITNSCMHDFYDISNMDDEQIEKLKQELQAKKHRVNRFKEVLRTSFATEFFPDDLKIAEKKLKEYYYQNARKNEVFKKFVYHNLIDWQMTGLKELDNFVIRSHAYQYAAEVENDKLTVTARNTATQAILKIIEDDQKKATKFLSDNLVETFRLIRQKDRDHIAKSIIEFVSKEQSISQDESDEMIAMVKDAIRQDNDRRADKDKKDNYTIDKIVL